MFLAALNRIVTLPDAQADRFGLPAFAGYGLDASLTVVDDVLSQDRSLTGRVAVSAVQSLRALISCVPGDGKQAVDLAFQAIGMRDATARTADVSVADFARDTMPAEQLEAARVEAGLLLSALADHYTESGGTKTNGMFRRLQTQSDPATLSIDRDFIGLVCLAIGRSHHSARVTDLPLVNPELAVLPSMSVAGWYPNPTRYGEVTPDGSCTAQRFWDGDWTDRVRVRQGRGWQQASITLFDV